MTGVSGISYNGTDLRTLGLYANGDKVFSSPEKSYRKVSIPGRGDLFFWDGTYKNINVEYETILLPVPIFNSTSFEEKFKTNVASIRSTLLSAEGYVRIEDTYNPDEFRLGVFEGPLDVDAIYLQAGKARIRFNCKAERFLKSGESEVTISSSSASAITNPTLFESKPIITISTTSSVGVSCKVNNSTFSFTSGSGTKSYILDSEEMDFYEVASGIKTLKNSMLTIDDFPVLIPGANAIYKYGSASNYTLKITPRWYIL